MCPPDVWGERRVGSLKLGHARKLVTQQGDIEEMGLPMVWASPQSNTAENLRVCNLITWRWEKKRREE